MFRDPEKSFFGFRIQGSKRDRIPNPGCGSAILVRYNMNSVSKQNPASVVSLDSNSSKCPHRKKKEIEKCYEEISDWWDAS
jgi:hypothetical protein